MSVHVQPESFSTHGFLNIFGMVFRFSGSGHASQENHDAKTTRRSSIALCLSGVFMRAISLFALVPWTAFFLWVWMTPHFDGKPG